MQAGRGAVQSLITSVHCGCAGVQMHEAVPATELPEYDIEEDENPIVRLGKYACGHLVVRGPEYFEDERDPYAFGGGLL